MKNSDILKKIKIREFIELYLTKAIAKRTTPELDADMERFLFDYTYFTSRVMREDQDMFKCFANKLFAHYAAHRLNDWELGIEEMTNATMELIGRLALEKEEKNTETHPIRYI